MRRHRRQLALLVLLTFFVQGVALAASSVCTMTAGTAAAAAKAAPHHDHDAAGHDHKSKSSDETCHCTLLCAQDCVAGASALTGVRACSDLGARAPLIIRPLALPGDGPANPPPLRPPIHPIAVA